MNRIAAFNPEHDMALANGDSHFIAPRNIREMARDLSPLMNVMNNEGILVWGWDHTIKTQLQRMGIDEVMLPTDTALTALRSHSERRSAHHLLHKFRDAHPDGPYIGESTLAHSIDDIANYATQHGHIILKDPLSSSGKGLRHVNINEDENFQQEPLSLSSLSKVKNWANALIRRHGYLTAEPYYDKEQDFAMEFCIRDQRCQFIGYSLFNTNHHGRYESNQLMSTEKIETLLTQYIHHSALHEVHDWIISHSDHFIPREWDTTKHPLYFGIDMMIVRESLQAENNSQSRATNACELKKQDKKYLLHPCVEINLRLNMGIIANEVHRKLLATGTEGTYHITTFPSGEAAQLFHKEHIEQYPTVYKEGRIVSGYHPLTPILPHTRYHAYVICKQG